MEQELRTRVELKALPFCRASDLSRGQTHRGRINHAKHSNNLLLSKLREGVFQVDQTTAAYMQAQFAAMVEDDEQIDFFAEFGFVDPDRRRVTEIARSKSLRMLRQARRKWKRAGNKPVKEIAPDSAPISQADDTPIKEIVPVVDEIKTETRIISSGAELVDTGFYLASTSSDQMARHETIDMNPLYDVVKSWIVQDELSEQFKEVARISSFEPERADLAEISHTCKPDKIKFKDPRTGQIVKRVCGYCRTCGQDV
jgi:hypothetical protein